MDGIASTKDFPLTGSFLAGRRRHLCAPETLAQLEAAMEPPRPLGDGEVLVKSGTAAVSASILVDGFMVRSVNDEGRRFIVGVHVPGDFVDLHGLTLGHLDHDLVAIGPVQVASIGHDRLRGLAEKVPELGSALWFATLLDGAIHRQWIRNLEALDAPQRIAHVFAELNHRLRLVGRDPGRTLRTPFTQTDLADMCGVSAIHANRAVARLRELGLGEIRRGALYIGDWAALEAYARFDPAYLYEAKA